LKYIGLLPHSVGFWWGWRGDEHAVEDVRAVVKSLREDRAVVDWSEHMLAVCRARTNSGRIDDASQ